MYEQKYPMYGLHVSAQYKYAKRVPQVCALLKVPYVGFYT